MSRRSINKGHWYTLQARKSLGFQPPKEEDLNRIAPSLLDIWCIDEWVNNAERKNAFKCYSSLLEACSIVMSRASWNILKPLSSA